MFIKADGSIEIASNIYLAFSNQPIDLQGIIATYSTTNTSNRFTLNGIDNGYYYFTQNGDITFNYNTAVELLMVGSGGYGALSGTYSCCTTDLCNFSSKMISSPVFALVSVCVALFSAFFKF